MRPRILFVSYTSRWTGPTNSLLLLVLQLRDRYDITVLAPGQGALSERLASEGIPYRSVRRLSRWAIPGLVRMMRREGFHLVYANNESGASRNALIAASLAGVPAICHVREMVWARSRWQLAYLKTARAVIAVSQASARSVARAVRPDRLNVVYNGVPVSALEGSSREGERIRGELGLDQDAVLVVGLGHVCPRKGQQRAVEAFRRATGTDSNAHLCLVGGLDRDPSYVRELERQIRDGDLEGRVSILGFRRDIKAILDGADVMIHTAVADPHPRAVLEGMAAGLPIVAFAVDGVAETLVDGETGFLVTVEDVSRLSDMLGNLINDPKLRSEFGVAGRCRVRKEFTDRVTAANVGAVIDEALAGERPSDGRATVSAVPL